MTDSDSPVIIVFSWNGPVDHYDVVSKHDRDDIWLTGTRDECLSEFPDAPVVDPTR
jgi:hypothetical protein